MSLSYHATAARNYQITLNNWLNITPDFQYIVRPDGLVGRAALPHASVVGMQLLVTF
jgi:carbohydrate-selective porin OprB